MLVIMILYLEKINSLFEEIRKFIKDIYVKTKEVRGAEITHNLA